MGDDKGLPGPPSRRFGYSLEWLRTSPGARKEGLKRRDYRRTPSARTHAYAELHAASAFSFLGLRRWAWAKSSWATTAQRMGRRTSPARSGHG